MLYQARITTPSLLLFVASSCYFFVGSQSFDWKCWKMMSISTRSYSCSCYKPSLFTRYQRCSLNIKNNSESSENVFSTDTELPLFICFFFQQSSHPAPVDSPILDSLQKISALLDREIQSLVCPSLSAAWTTEMKCQSPFSIHTFPSFLNSGLHLKLW